jgi:hypothetical protein
MQVWLPNSMIGFLWTWLMATTHYFLNQNPHLWTKLLTNGVKGKCKEKKRERDMKGVFNSMIAIDF